MRDSNAMIASLKTSLNQLRDHSSRSQPLLIFTALFAIFATGQHISLAEEQSPNCKRLSNDQEIRIGQIINDFRDGRISSADIIADKSLDSPTTSISLYISYILNGAKFEDSTDIDPQLALQNVINFPIYMNILKNKTSYEETASSQIKSRYFSCTDFQRNPIVDMIRYQTEHEFISTSKNTQKRLSQLRSAATISTKFLDEYTRVISRIDSDQFKIEIDFWEKSGLHCISIANRHTCIDAIAAHVRKSITSDSERAKKQILCSVSIIDGNTVLTANVCQ